MGLRGPCDCPPCQDGREDDCYYLVALRAGLLQTAAARTDVPDLLHEIDRLRAANDQLAQLLADRDQREDTLNDDIAALQAENQAWQSYATWSCTRDGATYPCGDCAGCRSWRGRPWEHFQHEVETEAARYHEHACIHQQQRDTLRARIDAALALHAPHTLTSGFTYCTHCGYDDNQDGWPCATARALSGEGATNE